MIMGRHGDKNENHDIMLQEHKFQSVIAAFQCAVVILGIISATLMLKAAGFPESRQSWPGLPVFVRNWGLVYLLVPIVWVFVTVYLERKDDIEFGKRGVVISGLLVLLALFIFFFWVSARAIVSPIGG